MVLHEALVFGGVEAATRPIAPEQSGSLAQFLVRGLFVNALEVFLSDVLDWPGRQFALAAHAASLSAKRPVGQSAEFLFGLGLFTDDGDGLLGELSDLDIVLAIRTAPLFVLALMLAELVAE